MKTDTAAGRHIYFGWWVLIAGFVINFVNIGAGVYPFGVFFKHVEDEFGWSRATLSAAMSVSMVAAGVCGLVVGRICNRVSAKTIAVPGILMCSAGFIMAGMVNSVWQFYVAYAILGAGMGIAGSVLITNTVTNWFHRRRAIGIWLTMAGINVGALVTVPLSEYLIDHLGWRHAYLSLGLGGLALELPLTLLALRTAPRKEELEASGELVAVQAQTSSLAQSGGASDRLVRPKGLSEAMRSPGFWLMVSGVALVGLSSTGVTTHQIPYLTDVGVSESVAAFALAVGMGFGILGKILLSYLSDRFHIRYVTIWYFGAQAIGVVLLMMAHSTGTVWPFVVVWGIACGATAPLMAMLTVELYSMSSFGIIYAVVMATYIIGSIVGPPVAGSIFDMTGSYTVAFFTFIGVYALSVIAIYLVWGLMPEIGTFRKKGTAGEPGQPGLERP